MNVLTLVFLGFGVIVLIGFVIVYGQGAEMEKRKIVVLKSISPGYIC